MTRPRAADDFAAINARLAELRRERELASKPGDRSGDERALGPQLAKGSETRYRPDRADLPGLGAGRRVLPARR